MTDNEGFTSSIQMTYSTLTILNTFDDRYESVIRNTSCNSSDVIYDVKILQLYASPFLLHYERDKKELARQNKVLYFLLSYPLDV